MSDQATTPATPTPTPAAPAAPAPTSPFAAPPAGTSAIAATGATAAEVGDTSFLDHVSAREPLMRSGVFPGVIAAMAVKTSNTSGNAFLSISVTLYGEKMMLENGDPVSPGKRLTSSFFSSSKTEDGLRIVGRKLKNILLALHDVPLDGKEDATYAAWPPVQKVARASFDSLSLNAFEPTDKWVGTKVMVDVRGGKDMDGNPRNEFNLLAASTKPVERKGRK